MMSVTAELKQLRLEAGLSQTELARRTGITQPRISAYESGRVAPSEKSLRRIGHACRLRPSVIVYRKRDDVIELANRRGLSNVRVFGSSVHGTDTVDSDVDLLVTSGPGTSIFDLAGFHLEVEELLGASVDVVDDRSKADILERIRREAVPL